MRFLKYLPVIVFLLFPPACAHERAAAALAALKGEFADSEAPFRMYPEIKVAVLPGRRNYNFGEPISATCKVTNMSPDRLAIFEALLVLVTRDDNYVYHVKEVELPSGGVDFPVAIEPHETYTFRYEYPGGNPFELLTDKGPVYLLGAIRARTDPAQSPVYYGHVTKIYLLNVAPDEKVPHP